MATINNISKFIIFLKKHNIHTAFIKNHQAEMPNSDYFTNNDYFTNAKTIGIANEELLSSAFTWSDSPEGLGHWAAFNILWLKETL